VQLPANATPPKGISTPRPAVEHLVAAAGVDEVVIVVKFVVTASGDVTSVSVARGHPSVPAALVIAAVKTWKFQPATLDGAPISVFRAVKLRYKLKQ